MGNADTDSNHSSNPSIVIGAVVHASCSNNATVGCLVKTVCAIMVCAVIDCCDAIRAKLTIDAPKKFAEILGADLPKITESGDDE